MAKSGPHNIPEIDALRGLAAVCVACIFHLFFLFGERFTGPFDGLPVVTWLYDHGWTMVDLFFVISGYVFSHVYLSSDHGKLVSSGRSFWVARFARLYPLHMLTVILFIPIILSGVVHKGVQDNFDLYHFGLNLLLLQGVGLERGYNFNVVSWSVSVEVLCYFLFFFAARTGGRALTVVAGLAIVAGVAMTWEGNAFVGRGLSGFFAGYFAWRLRAFAVPTWCLVACVVIPFLWVPDIFKLGTYLGLTAFPAMILLAQRMPFLAGKLFRWLGDRSYSIYLLHPVIYLSGKAFVPDFYAMREAHPELVAFTAIALVFLASDFSYRRFEMPLRRLIRDRLGEPSEPYARRKRAMP